MNNNSKNLQEGIQFKKLDLHVHTYKSYNDFERDGVSDNDLQQLADKICQTAKDKGLSGIAITDHNTGEAVDEIKTANEKLKTGLTIIPGTEVDVFEGFHVICLFPNKTTSAQIRDWLIGLGMDASNIGKTDFAPSKNTTLQAVRESVDKLNGLMVAAHADSSNQSLFSAKKSSGSKFVEGKMDVAKFDAIETKNIQRLKSNYSQFIEGYAIYQASDNHRQNQDGTQGKHCYSTIGEPYTWFKLDEISVDGLRQCFIDPEVRIKQIDEWKPEMLDGVPRILSLEIKTKNGFFADGEKFIFNTDINSFLGGKGAGKSLVLEYLRFVLNDIANDDYIKQDSVYKLIATLGCGGKVIIQVQTEHGDIYVFAREFDPKKISEPVITRGQKLTPELCERIFASSQTSVASKDGVLKPNLDARQLFPIVAYSQTEIFTLARDKQSQLKLLDKCINKTEFLTDESVLIQKLQKNDAEIIKSLQAKWELPQLVKYHTTLKEKLDAKSKQAKNPKYEKGSKIKDSYGVAQSVITELFAIKDGVVDNLEQQKSIIEQEIAKYPKENNPAKSKLKTLLKLVDSFIKQERDCDKKVVQISNKVDDEFEKFKQQYKKFLDESSIKITMEEEDEVRQAKEQVQKAEGLAKKYDKLFTGREELLNQLETLRDNFTKIREEKYKELTNKSADRLRLSLIKGDNKELFRTKIKELLSHSGTKPETYIDSLIERNTSRQFVNKIIAEKTNELQNDIGQNTQVDCEKIVAHLKNKIVELLPLQYQWVYIDEPKIELNVKPLESEPYKELSQLSVGQKSTALLVISLLEGCSPVLIDQPEDALDLKSVIQDVSERLRQYKTRRQFILTTHNSSVAVSSDSDKYFILEPEGDKGRLLFSGAIDTEAIREQVINYLEGGTKSYDLKRKKYKKS